MISTRILSTPLSEQIASNGPEVMEQTAANKVVDYVFRHANGLANATATEDIFNPTTRIDFTDAFNDMTTQCGISDLVTKQSRVSMQSPNPTGWGWSGNIYSYIHGNLLTPGSLLTGTFRVDFTGCVADSNFFDVLVQFTGSNTVPLSKTLRTQIVTNI
jgi:hypothetical protein